MKNYIVLAIILFFYSKTGFSQLKKDSTIIKKNEISIDLLPIMKIFSDIDQGYNFRGTTQYKRLLKNNFYFRFGFTLIKKHRNKTYSDPIRSYVDSIHDGVNFHSYEYKPEVQFNSGIEYRWGKKKLKYFAGIDIGYAYSEIIYKEYYVLTEKYTNFYPNNVRLYSDFSNKKNDFHESVTYSRTDIKNAICFTPFYGIQYHFSKQFFFSMQLSIQLQYNQKYKETTINEPFGIINNFSIAYRF